MNAQGTLADLELALRSKRDELSRQISWDLEHSRCEAANSGDLADAAQDEVQSELSSQLVALESRELDQINRALSLIRLGAYGCCEGCGGQIDPVRLEALPNATQCIRCARRSSRRAAAVAVKRWSSDTIPHAEESAPRERISLHDLEMEYT
jgi:DnaK suppressor protein